MARLSRLRIAALCCLLGCSSFGDADAPEPPITGTVDESFVFEAAPARVSVVQGGLVRIPLGVKRTEGLRKKSLPVDVTLEGAPPGVTADPLSIPGIETRGELVVRATADAPQGEIVLRVVGIAPGTEARATTTAPILVRGPLASIDRTFGNNGAPTFFFGEGADAYLHQAILLPDGRAVAMGTAATGPGLFAFAQIDASGKLDAAFNVDGKSFVTPPGNVNPSTGTLVRLPSGAIQFVTSGLLSRITPAGDLDTTFGTGGSVAGLPSNGVFAPDGALFTIEGMDTVLRFTKRTVAGALDVSFGNAGVRDVTLPGGNAAPAGLAVRANGSVVAGVSTTSTGAFLVQVTAAGAPDASFGNGGILAMGQTPLEYIVEQPDGRVLAAGATDASGWTIARAGDDSFASGGRVWPPITDQSSVPLTKPIVLADGRIVVVVAERLVRFTKDGAVDPITGRAGLPIAHAKTPAGIHSALLVSEERILFFSSQIVAGGKTDFYATRIWL